MSFSVVIPLYNKALHIERALRSVFDQTCQDFEVIVVNDGSTDNGRQVMESIHNPKLRVIDQSNMGVSVARNRGIEAATNEFVAFLDADDEWLPDYLNNIQILINNFPDCGAYATALRTIRPNGHVNLPNQNNLPSEPWIGILPNFFELFQEGLAFHPSSIVIPKQILLDVGGFPAGVILFEDIVCWVNIAIRYPIAYSSKRLIIYHQDSSNRSDIHKDLSEAPFIGIIRDAINNGLIQRELQLDAFEFIAQRQIYTATNNVMEGNPTYARHLLGTCIKTRKYKKKWLWWRFWASFPAGWPGKFLIFKQKIIKVR